MTKEERQHHCFWEDEYDKYLSATGYFLQWWDDLPDKIRKDIHPKLQGLGINEQKNTCYKCDAEIDEEDIVCCNCIDNTDGRNQHFWKIKDEQQDT